MSDDEKSCANTWCTCSVRAPAEFCSAACAEQAAHGIPSPCNCSHETCEGTVHESLREG